MSTHCFFPGKSSASGVFALARAMRMASQYRRDFKARSFMSIDLIDPPD